MWMWSAFIFASGVFSALCIPPFFLSFLLAAIFLSQAASVWRILWPLRKRGTGKQAQNGQKAISRNEKSRESVFDRFSWFRLFCSSCSNHCYICSNALDPPDILVDALEWKKKTDRANGQKTRTETGRNEQEGGR
jgi:hypothetical protein